MTYTDFKKIVDHLHDEIMIYDADYQLVYVNNASIRHYGKTPAELIGMKFEALDEVYWGNSTLPEVYEKKNMVAKRQITNMGKEVMTISLPIFDANGSIVYVAQSVNDIVSRAEIDRMEKNDIQIGENKKTNYLYQSTEMQYIMDFVKRISSVKTPCLILGETGTGKSLLAQCMHESSERKDKPFIAVNCACMNANLLESELFGYKKGAFSGANCAGKKGIVQLANGGTLFLDEISELPHELQGKLLQFVQTQEFIPLGSEKVHKVDVRIICATNREIKKMVEMNQFREDLYYRLNLFEILIPPLRNRRKDITLLIEYYLKKYNRDYLRQISISAKAMEHLENYDWPGNIRELSHIVEKLVVLAKEKEVQEFDLPEEFSTIYKQSETIQKPVGTSATPPQTLDEALENTEAAMVRQAYQECHTSVKVAEKLGISQPRAYRLMKKYLFAGNRTDGI